MIMLCILLIGFNASNVTRIDSNLSVIHDVINVSYPIHNAVELEEEMLLRWMVNIG